jgi:hypothetical protein
MYFFAIVFHAPKCIVCVASGWTVSGRVMPFVAGTAGVDELCKKRTVHTR